MFKIESEIDIEATAAEVWSTLVDFESYGEWNPFITHIEGRRRKGERIRVTLEQAESKPMVFKPRVIADDENRCFSWSGHLLIPGLFDGDHSFDIEPLGEGSVRFRQHETFRGVLVPLLKKTLKEKTLPSFEAMNRALKERVER